MIQFRRSPEGESEWIRGLLDLAETTPDREAAMALRQVRSNPKRFRFQLLVGLGRFGSEGLETKHFEYRVEHEYIYPASAIKLFASIGVLMEWTHLRKKYPWLNIDDAFSLVGEPLPKPDKTNLIQGHQTLHHEIRQTQIVSSNVSFNRVLDAVTIQRLGLLLSKAFPSVRVFHHLYDAVPVTPKVGTPSLHVLRTDPSSSTVVQLRRKGVQDDRSRLPRKPFCDTPYTGFGHAPHTLMVGRQHYERDGGPLIPGPMDFTDKNRASLYDFQRAIAAINGVPVGPLLDPGVDFDGIIEPDWLKALRTATRELPSRSTNPRYDHPWITDARFKPMLPGVLASGVSEASLIYSNKGGGAYGFVVENAFVALRSHGSEEVERSNGCAHIMLTGSVYANQNQTVNDNSYEYATISKPAFRAIGYAIGKLLKRGNCSIIGD